MNLAKKKKRGSNCGGVTNPSVEPKKKRKKKAKPGFAYSQLCSQAPPWQRRSLLKLMVLFLREEDKYFETLFLSVHCCRDPYMSQKSEPIESPNQVHQSAYHINVVW
jgi:hypothetical protein